MRKTVANISKPQSHKSKTSTTDDTLRLLAFNNSLQANIISTVSSGKIIIANGAACKLLGYSKKELLTRRRSDIFDIRENSFKKMLKQRSSQGQSSATVTAITKVGKRFPAEITSAVFMDENEILKAITTIANMSQGIRKQKDIDTKNEKRVADNIVLAKSKQKKIDTKNEKIVRENIILALAESDARFAANNEWIKYISKTSYDVMWDWDIKTGRIYVGGSFKEVFGYKLKDETVYFKDFVACLLPEEKKEVEQKISDALASASKSWNDSYMFKRKDGSIASTVSRASIVRDENGKAIRLIGAIQDVSKLQELKKKLEIQVSIQEELAEIFIVAAKLSFDGIWDWNLLTGEFYLGAGFEELFGYTMKNHTGNISTDWVNYVHPDDRQSVQQGLQNAIKSPASYWEHAYRFVRADGSVANVFNRASIIRNAAGTACRIIGAMQDTSKQMLLEEQLKHEIVLKEKQIAEAAEEARDTARSDIGKELHDNITQLLGVSKMYLEMAKQGDNDSQMYLSRSSEYTLTAIEEIRKLTKGLTTDIIKSVGLYEAIEHMIRDTMEVNQIKISCSLKGFKEDSVNNKFKLNVFRIIQEQLNNILKHAHAEKVNITLTQNKKSIVLCISDNGIGFDTSKKQNGIGVANIKSRALAYNGIADFNSQPGQSCVLSVTFPASDALLDNGMSKSS
ncbi:MAG: PAS domain-containing protein [Chitinophagaceae bacterium]|nr:PAS domain-containing protein [Chitinophagaceae bacterium]